MEGTVAQLLGVAGLQLPLDSINALANTITAVAVLWAARSLRRSLTDVRLLRLQPPFSGLQRGRERLLRDIERLDDEDRERDADDFR